MAWSINNDGRAAVKDIIFTGGGTAGHVSPNIALIRELLKKGYSIGYIGTHNGIERSLIADIPQVEYFPVRSGKYDRSKTLGNISEAFGVLRGVRDAKEILRRERPKVVFSKGGFVTVPVVYAANKLGIPSVIHESDLTMGLANKLSSRWCNKVCVTFKDTLGEVGKKGVWTGTPLRQELFEGKKQIAMELCGFGDDKPTLMVMGGSLGARAINLAVRGAIKELTSRYNVIHVCGKGNTDKDFDGIRGYKQFEYVKEELPHLLAAADCVLSRAGANSIFEFLALNKPMLLIPLPKGSSRGDQIINAQSFEKAGWAMMMDQEMVNTESLLNKIEDLFSQSAIMRTRQLEAPVKNANETILSMIMEHL